MAEKASHSKPKSRRSSGKPVSKVSVTVLLLLLALSVVSVATFQRYAFAEIDLFPLWYVALGLGLLGGWLFVYKFVGREHSLGKRIGAFLLMSLLAFFAAGTMLAHINHLFDTSEPVRYTVVIEDTEYRHSKHASHRLFTVTVQGDTFDVEVPRRHYATYDVGDSYVIEYREGALGEPYYVAVGGVPENTNVP